MSTYRMSLDGTAADDTMRQIDDAVELAVRRHEVFTEANRQIDGITVTRRSPDGAVEVTVGSNGNVLNVRCTEMVRTMPPHQVATTLQHVLQAAQAGVASRVAEILRAAAPDDPLTAHLVAKAHNAFPPPPTPTPGSPADSRQRQMAIGAIESDDAVQPYRPARRRPSRGRNQNPDDWTGRSILS